MQCTDPGWLLQSRAKLLWDSSSARWGGAHLGIAVNELEPRLQPLLQALPGTHDPLQARTVSHSESQIQGIPIRRHFIKQQRDHTIAASSKEIIESSIHLGSLRTISLALPWRDS